jgi:RsiW-degrading membrane proteinase PrsW (M82 family)
MPGQPRNNLAFTVVVTVLAVLGGSLMALVVALSGAPSILLLATLLAVLPVGPLVLCFLWLDRYEPEPRRLLAAGLVWGACVATGGAVLVQGVGEVGVGWSQAFSLAAVAPVTEEATKGLFLLLLLWWRRHELDGVLDGIVYAGMVGIGFAFVENVLYLTAAWNGTGGTGAEGAGALTATFLVRCLASPFAHPFFTAFTGIGVGIAVGSRRPLVRVVAPLAGYALAVVAHGLWNGSALLGAGGFLRVYLGIMFPALVLVVGFALWARRSERRMLTTSLEDAAARGLLPATDIPWLVDLGARRRGRAWARAHGGAPAEQALRDYQQAAVELGFLHHRYLRGTAPDDAAARGNALVARIHAARPYVSFPGQVVPLP